MSMKFWFYAMVATGPLAFYLWYEWTYRWEIFDGCADRFWRRLRTDIYISLPGQAGKMARITRVRAHVRKFAKMESPRGTVLVTGVNEPFRRIQKDKRYADYEHIFLRPKWMLWAMLALSLVCQ